MKLVSILPLLSLARAATLEIIIPPTVSLPNPNSLSFSTRAYLSSKGDALVSVISRQNTFFFPSVPVGSHLLTVVSRENLFENLRIDVTADPTTGQQSVEAWTTWRGNEWSNTGESRVSGDSNRGKTRLEVKAVAAKEYYMQRPGFSVASIFSNPMILIGIATLVMVVGLPWLMDNLDPEIKAEFEEMQRKQTGVTSQASNLHNLDIAGDFASWMSGGAKSGQIEGSTSNQKKK